MKRLFAICVVVLIVGGAVQANVITLKFDPNDLFNYATSDDTRLNQQGTARAIWGQDRTTLDLNGTGETGRYYQTYNDGADPYDRMDDAVADNDLRSVQTILDWTAGAGHQGMNWMQLYLQAGSGKNWGERVVVKDSSTWTASVNGEFGWRCTTTDYGTTPVYDTLLGGDPATNQNAISPDFNPAEELFSITGDFFYDTNGNGVYDAGDTDLAWHQDYTIWFFAKLNNWTYIDDYGNGIGGNPGYIEGTIIATTVPEPATLTLLALGGLAFLGRRKRRA